MTPKWLAALAVAAALAACADLPDVSPNTCGNGVLEPGEDCEPSSTSGSTRCGAAGAPDQCLYECDHGISDGVQCPTGYSCGTDGQCRQAAGRFQQATSTNLNADAVTTGDIDGDGYADLVTAAGTTVQVSFGSPQADLASSVSELVATPEQGVAVGDLDGDGHDDVLVGTSPGIQSFLGSSDGTLDPFSYPFASFSNGSPTAYGVALDLDPTSAPDETLGVWDSRIGFPVVGGDIALPAGGNTDPNAQPPAPVLLPPLATARLTANRALGPLAPQQATIDIALGYAGGSTIYLDRAVMTPTSPSVPTVVDTGVTLGTVAPLQSGSGLFFGWFDGDDCEDLIAHVGIGFGRLILFRNTLVNGQCTGVLRAPVDLYTFDHKANLLAAGDFDGDGTTDLVTSDGVFRVVGSGPWTLPPLAAAGQSFGGAIVADFNSDGLPDVAAFRNQQPDVEVLINNAGRVFDSFVVSTAFTVVHLEAGDFDGDLTGDLAIEETDTTVDPTEYVISVSYGTHLGPPGPRVAMDRFPATSGVIASNLVGASGAIDGAEDLIVLQDLGTTMQATTLFGAGSRAMTSPLVLTTGGVQGVETPLAFVLAPIDGDQFPDVFAVGRSVFSSSGVQSAFLYKGDGAGGFTLSGSATWPATFAVEDAAWATGALGSSGVASIAAAEHHQRDGGGTVHVLLFQPDPSNLPTNPQLAQLDGYQGAHTLRIVDLDGDGDNDLLVTLDPTTSAAGTLEIGWNEGGTISGLVPLADADGCIDAVTLQLDGDPKPELLALCKNADTGDYDLRKFDAAEADTLLSNNEAVATGLSGGRTTRLLAADINGDGLTDLVIATRRDATADITVLTQMDVHASK